MNFIFRGDEMLVADNGRDLPDAAACARLGLAPDAMQRVWLNRDPHCRTAIVAREAAAPEGYAFHKLRALLAGLGERGALAGRAFQVAEWARTHRYCGVCATPLRPLENELCLRCPACGQSSYPRISPAMMVLVRDGQRILLARHAHYATARYTALAGFVEAGESIEQTVVREVEEEVGLIVRGLRYFGSQPWPFPHSLMIAFTADHAGGELRLQADEIADARWFGPGDALPGIPTEETIAGRLIRAHLPPGATLD